MCRLGYGAHAAGCNVCTCVGKHWQIHLQHAWCVRVCVCVGWAWGVGTVQGHAYLPEVDRSVQEDQALNTRCQDKADKEEQRHLPPLSQHRLQLLHPCTVWAHTTIVLKHCLVTMYTPVCRRLHSMTTYSGLPPD